MPSVDRERAMYRKRALASERDADEYPESRAECVVEAAWAWRHAGEAGRAVELLAEWPEWSDPFDRGMARVELAETLFEMDRPDEAWEELRRLLRERPPVDVCSSAAELLEMRGDLTEALRWFDVGVSTLSTDELDELRREDAFMRAAAYVVRGRRRVREALGLPADATDRLEPARPPVDDRLPRASRGPSMQDRTPSGSRVLFWLRADVPEAARRWPELFDVLPGDYAGDLERQLRDLPRPVRLVPARVEALHAFVARTGADVGLARTRADFAQQQDREGDVLVWPPGRNDSCWCGSGQKYKRCCLRA